MSSSMASALLFGFENTAGLEPEREPEPESMLDLYTEEEKEEECADAEGIPGGVEPAAMKTGNRTPWN